MALDQLRALARKNKEDAEGCISAFAAFRGWVEDAPRRWRGALVLERLEEIKAGVEFRLMRQGLSDTDGKRIWIFGEEDAPGRFLFAPIELHGGKEGWDDAERLAERGSVYLPLELFRSTFHGLAERVEKGEEAGEEDESGLMLYRSMKSEFDRHKTDQRRSGGR